MNTQWSAQKFNEIVAEIQKRSVTDADFRALALKDPAAAVTAVSGDSLPAGAKLRFVNQLEEVTVILPPATGGEELSEEQLEQVAGGAFFAGVAIATVGAVVGITVTINKDCM
jgi:hypothetical protein